MLELVLQPIFIVCPGETGDQGLSADKECTIAAANGVDSQAYGQVGFAHPGWAQQQDVLAVGDPTAAGQFLDTLGRYSGDIMLFISAAWASSRLGAENAPR